MKRKIVAVVENHFDQIWRRCFSHDIVFNGQNFVSYEKIEGYYIDENLRLAKKLPGYKFQIETPCVVENYLRRFPEREEELRDLYRQGVLKTTNTGYTILDSNMISPEAIVRNYLLADAFFARFVGATPRIANRSDAFGNSAQMPQILKAFGASYVTESYYNPYDDDVWVGLDKSAICVKRLPHPGNGGGWVKYPPCGACKGFGKVAGATCALCDGRGIDLQIGRQKWSPVHLSRRYDHGQRAGLGERRLANRSSRKTCRAIALRQELSLALACL